MQRTVGLISWHGSYMAGRVSSVRSPMDEKILIVLDRGTGTWEISPALGQAVQDMLAQVAVCIERTVLSRSY